LLLSVENSVNFTPANPFLLIGEAG
jgi:hypothetical protein